MWPKVGDHLIFHFKDGRRVSGNLLEFCEHRDEYLIQTYFEGKPFDKSVVRSFEFVSIQPKRV